MCYPGGLALVIESEGGSDCVAACDMTSDFDVMFLDTGNAPNLRFFVHSHGLQQADYIAPGQSVGLSTQTTTVASRVVHTHGLD